MELLTAEALMIFMRSQWPRMGHRDPKLDCRKTLMRIGVVNGVGVQNGVWRRCYLQTAFISRENNGLILLDIDEWRLWREMEILGAKYENWSKIGSEIWQVGQLWPKLANFGQSWPTLANFGSSLAESVWSA